MIVSIAEQLEVIEKLMKKAEEDVRNAPEGVLIVKARGNRTEWAVRGTDSTRRYLAKREMTFARALAQAAYAREFLKNAEATLKDLRILERKKAERSAAVMYRVLAKPYERLPEARRALVTPYVLPDKAFAQQWEAVPYEGKAFREDTPVILTAKGERVRSKSEKMIADLLFRMKIPYRYENPMTLRGMGTVYPDFTLLDPASRKTVLLEHFGRMDDPEYLSGALRKIDAYEKNGYCQGQRLLCTFESAEHVIDMKHLEILLKTTFHSEIQE